MAKRLRANVGLTYPRDAASLKAVRKAGGRNKLLPEALATLYKRIEAGGFCDDIPKGSMRDHMLTSGEIEEVEVKAPAKGRS